jgi:hypothetical protein
MKHNEHSEQQLQKTSVQVDCDRTPHEVDNYSKLSEILSLSPTCDMYCRSALYFALTGRSKIWTVKHGSKYLILVRHPNIARSLLAFFPFVTDAMEFVEQIQVLSNLNSFLLQFRDVFLARVPEPIVKEVLEKPAGQKILDYHLEAIVETKLDWAYPSYDVCLKRLVDPKGGKLRTYRKKIRKFFDRDVEVINLEGLDLQELQKAFRQVSKSWIRTKLKGGDSIRNAGVSLRELIDPYRTLAQLNGNISLDIGGIILRRGETCLGFGVWEWTRNSEVIPCLAALPCSYEKGLSEYLYYHIACRLSSEGYDRMCIGGSETANSDQFKQKFDPVATHRLRTFRLSPQGPDSTATNYVNQQKPTSAIYQ